MCCNMLGVWLSNVVVDRSRLDLGVMCLYKNEQNGGLVEYFKTQTDDGSPQYLLANIFNMKGDRLDLRSEIPERFRCCILASPQKRNMSEDTGFIRAWPEYADSIGLSLMRRLDRKIYMKAKVALAHVFDWEHIQLSVVNAIVSDRPMSLQKDYTSEYTAYLEQEYRLELSCTRPIRQCCSCGMMSEERMKRCACRNGFYYCSKQCQKSNWAYHRTVCSLRRH